LLRHHGLGADSSVFGVCVRDAKLRDGCTRSESVQKQRHSF
jgi:hypothetical protein